MTEADAEKLCRDAEKRLSELTFDTK